MKRKKRKDGSFVIEHFSYRNLPEHLLKKLDYEHIYSCGSRVVKSKYLLAPEELEILFDEYIYISEDSEA